MQGSSHDVVGAVAILLFQYGQISDNNYSYSLPARNLRKEINIKLYKGIMMKNEDNVYIVKFRASESECEKKRLIDELRNSGLTFDVSGYLLSNIRIKVKLTPDILNLLYDKYFISTTDYNLLQSSTSIEKIYLS